MNHIFWCYLSVLSVALAESPVSSVDGDNGTIDIGVNGPGMVGVPATNFVSSNHLQLGLGCFALLSALFGLAGLVFRVPCLLRVTAGFYVVYLVILTVPVIYFAQIAMQAFFSEKGSEWAWLYLLGLVFAMIFMAHGYLVMLKARTEMTHSKEKYEHMTREEQWW